MGNAPDLDPERFAASFSRFLEWVEGVAETRESPFASLLHEHFGESPSTFPVTAETVAGYDLPNLQLALDAYLKRSGVEHRLLGFGGHVEFIETSLSGLVHDAGFGITVGPVRRSVVPLEEGRSIPCVTTGLFLITDGDARLAALLTQNEHGFGDPGLRLDVMAPTPEAGERFVAELRGLMHELNVYRGKVLALRGGGDMDGGGMSVEFLKVSAVGRDDIVLPDGLLDVVELHTVEFAEHTAAMLAGGRHLRRGLLLHGPPGTGKTLTAGFLISQLEGRTVIVLTGGALGLIGAACAIARDLQPSLVVLEDVDLVAHERTSFMGTTSLLFELLNEMDGIGEDADVIFVMTTNRADLLEPALATRPGRVDQAIEFPLPDSDARGRLLDLFCRGLDADLRDRPSIVGATDGASPAFLRELVRKAALFSARDGSGRVADEHFRQALALLELGGTITRSILGADGGAAAERLNEDDDWEIDEDD
jgi:ATPase family associated with various cellular activities (AAA)